MGENGLGCKCHRLLLPRDGKGKGKMRKGKEKRKGGEERVLQIKSRSRAPKRFSLQ